jgi:lipopolysaccharide export system permease protein
MLCYSRYIIRNLLGPTTVITLTLTGIIWLTQSLRFIDLIVNRGLSFVDFLYLSSLIIPSLLMVILPIALFCAVLFTYNKLMGDSELIVLHSAGLSKMALARPAILVAIGITLLNYIITLYLLPASYRAFKDTQTYIRDNYASVLIEEGVFNSPVKGLSVYVEERKDGGMLKGILVHDGRAPERPVTMMAEEGRLVQTQNGPEFELINGNRQEVNRKDGQLSLLYFDRYTLDISQFTDAEAIDRWREPQERYLNELFYPGEDLPLKFQNKLYAEGHQRLSWPLYALGLTMLALAVLFSGQFNRRGQWRRIASCAMMSVGVVGLALALNNIVTKLPIIAPLMYINVLALIAVARHMLLDHPKKRVAS